MQQFCRGGGAAPQAVEFSSLCCQEVTVVQGRALCRGWAGQGGGGAALQRKRICAPVSPGNAPGTSVRCQLEELLCEASWADLATCYSRAKQVSTGSQRSHKEYLLIIHSSFFVCKYPLLLAPTCVTFYLEMCFCSGARAQHSPWKAESLSVKNSKPEVTL